MKAILFIGHGTRSKKGAAEISAFIERVKPQINVPILELSFLELTEPLIGEGFRTCVEKGATAITVVPLFLLAAGHIKNDIPEALAPLIDQNPSIPVVVKEPFGIQEEILDGVAELIRNVSGHVAPEDRILIVGVGSSDPEIHVHFSKIAGGIQERLGVELVSVCYFAATDPKVNEGMERISESAAGRVIVVPYMLFSGLLIGELYKLVRRRQKDGQQIICTTPLSDLRVIEEIVVQRAMKDSN